MRRVHVLTRVGVGGPSAREIVGAVRRGLVCVRRAKALWRTSVRLNRYGSRRSKEEQVKRTIAFTFEGQVGGAGEEAARSLANRLAVAAAVAYEELPTREDLAGLAAHLREVANLLDRMGVANEEEPSDLPEGQGGERRCP